MRFSVSLMHNAGSNLPGPARTGSHGAQLTSREKEEDGEEEKEEGRRNGEAAGLHLTRSHGRTGRRQQSSSKYNIFAVFLGGFFIY